MKPIENFIKGTFFLFVVVIGSLVLKLISAFFNSYTDLNGDYFVLGVIVCFAYRGVIIDLWRLLRGYL